MARFQDPSFCIKSIIDGIPRFVPVRPSIVRIRSVEDFLFAFVLAWLACTLSFIEFRPSSTQCRQFGGILRRYVLHHYRALHLLWYAMPTP